MSQSSDFAIDIDEVFPPLSKAPIVEAVIEFRGLNSSMWRPDAVLPSLEQGLSGYAVVETGIKQTIGISETGSGAQSTVSTSHQSELVGYRFRHKREPYIAQFEHKKYLLSRLAPYEDWDRFLKETFQLWQVHKETIGLEGIQRLGLRYVNAIEVPYDALLSDYLLNMPQLPNDLRLPHAGFHYNDLLVVPDTNYRVMLSRTIQPNQDNDSSYRLILDIDAVSEDPSGLEEGEIKNQLRDLRWLKNKSFFGSLTPICIEELR